MLPENGNGKVYLGIPRERIYLPQFVDNRDAILAQMHHAGIQCGYYQAEGHRVDRNRDRIVKEFLGNPENPEWLLMIDTDMEHPETIATRLKRWNKPIVGGLYFHRGRQHDPFAFRNAEEQVDEYGRTSRSWAPMRDEVYSYLINASIPMRDGAVVIDGVDEISLVECDAVATGAILIHRSVFEKIPAPWFEYEAGGISEDLAFCAKAKEQYGFPIYCDFSTISGHYSWVPMGQVQFRMNYENRGINTTAYTKRMASKWWSEFFSIPFEEAMQIIEEGSPHVVGDYWKFMFGDRKINRVEEHDFYCDLETGRLYILELLYWNFTSTYNTLRQMITHVRNQNVLNLGAGIGSEALQLIVQKNNVLAVEINELLRDFIDYRYGKMQEGLETSMGQLSIVGEEWMEKTPDSSLDAAIAFDFLEHLPEKDLRLVMKNISRVLKPGAHLFYHANWGQQDIYPMHHDHDHVWEQVLADNGFISMSPVEAIKARPR